MRAGLLAVTGVLCALLIFPDLFYWGRQGATGAQTSLALPDEVASLIQGRLTSDTGPELASLSPVEQARVRSLYESAGYAPRWVNRSGRLGGPARDGLTLLGKAALDGLDPADYGRPRLGALATTLEAAHAPRAVDVATFDLAMSAGMLRYLAHLHRGRVDPRATGLRLSRPPERLDVVMSLRSALEGGQITEMAERLTPPFAQYRRLREALARYRALAGDTRFQSLPSVSRAVHAGEPYAGLVALYHRLVLLGDLSGDTPAPAPGAVYEAPLVEGVKRFQARHGLEADGVIGHTTVAALLVPLDWRVRQIELALERLRWLPDLRDRRFVVLNIPMFTLWAWDSLSASETPSLEMRAIVGRAGHTPTPVFSKPMHALIFRPYWNIPRSILRDEILPAVARDRGLLSRENMEIVRGAGDDAQPVDATDENLALLRQGSLRLRQRPGPVNALGLVKFVFPNEENVHLHGTPAQRLFLRPRRDFSHGCVRVEDPVALAEWVLAGEPEWTRERILAAMSDIENVSQLVPLRRPIDVLLFYTTAMVPADAGAVRFAADIYGHDTRLDRALTRGSAR
ncbi:MAG TPA: L,D-transpeptidase family protein [Vicinamibacterales bacterium]|nr:L,D-transpeptidase family protein [Vicinamibacterales bacterium]